MRTRVLAVAVAPLLAGALAAGAAGAQARTGAGAPCPFPLYSKWFDVYKQERHVEINYQPIGSGAGIQQVKAGTVDFGASDAALSNAQLAEMPRKVLHVPTVAGAVVLAYNLPGLARPLQLTPDLVANIWLGRIQSWNDRRIAAVNPGLALPSSPILAVHRADGSGTTNIFTSYLAAVSGAWKELVGAGTSVSWPSGVGGKGNDGVSGVVRQTPGAIGYVELAYAKQNRLPFALLRNRAGNYIEASLASTTAAVEGSAGLLAKDGRTPIVNSASAAAYPIAGLTFLLVYQQSKDPAHGRALAEFLDWAIHDGQRYAEPLLYAKLPPSVVKVNEATLRLLAGTAKGGR